MHDAHKANFDQWFANSKVIDGQGLPLVVYHGTSTDFDSFKDLERRNGFYFTDDAAHASLYTTLRTGAPHIVPVHLSIQNPADLRGEISNELRVALNRAGYERTGDLMFSNPQARWEFFDQDPSLRKALEKAGFDGVTLTEPQPDHESAAAISWMAFQPGQIKSAIGNSGLYAVGNPDITDRQVTASHAKAFLSGLQKKAAPHA